MNNDEDNKDLHDVLSVSETQQPPVEEEQPGYEDLLRESLELIKIQKAEIEKNKQELLDLRKELEVHKESVNSIQTEIESKKPLKFEVEVVGSFDFSKEASKIYSEETRQIREMARASYDKILNEFKHV